MTAIEYLRRLQNKMEIRPPPIGDIIRNRSQQISAEDMERALSRFSVYTLEEQEKFYRDTLITPFIQTLPDDAIKSLKDVYVGLLETYDPNAWTILIHNNGPLVVLHGELLAAISYYSELQFLAAKLLDENTRLGVGVLNQGNRFILDCFREKRSRKYPRLPPKLTKEELCAVTLNTMAQELFVVAHEFSHIYLGHLGICVNKSVGVGNKKVSVHKFSREQQEEFDADVQAVKWLINLKDKDTNEPFVQWASLSIGIAIEVFMLFHLVEVNLGIPAETSSHPYSITRLKYILEKCGPLLSNEDNTYISEMISDASDIKSFTGCPTITQQPIEIVQ